MELSPQQLRMRALAKRNPIYQNYATGMTDPGLLNTDGTAATGRVREVINTPAQEAPATVSNTSLKGFNTLLNELAEADPRQVASFEEDLASIRGASDISTETKQELLDARLEKEVGGGMSKAELQDFETLIGRLEGSKMKQADQTNRARQREVMTRGLASMMRNF